MTQTRTVHLRARSAPLLFALICVGLALQFGCDDHGYRANVHSTGETRFDIQPVPTEGSSERVYTKSAQQPNGLKDADLEDVVNAWPKLSPADKKRVAAEARKAAGIPD